MNRASKTNTCRCSDGTTVTSAQADRKIRAASQGVMQKQKITHGYNFCTECGINDRHAIIDPSHEISVKECKETGQTEKAWDPANIPPRCRGCHNKHDKTNLQTTKKEKDEHG